MPRAADERSANAGSTRQDLAEVTTEALRAVRTAYSGSDTRAGYSGLTVNRAPCRGRIPSPGPLGAPRGGGRSEVAEPPSFVCCGWGVFEDVHPPLTVVHSPCRLIGG